LEVRAGLAVVGEIENHRSAQLALNREVPTIVLWHPRRFPVLPPRNAEAVGSGWIDEGRQRKRREAAAQQERRVDAVVLCAETRIGGKALIVSGSGNRRDDREGPRK